MLDGHGLFSFWCWTQSLSNAFNRPCMKKWLFSEAGIWHFFCKTLNVFIFNDAFFPLYFWVSCLYVSQEWTYSMQYFLGHKQTESTEKSIKGDNDGSVIFILLELRAKWTKLLVFASVVGQIFLVHERWGTGALHQIYRENMSSALLGLARTNSDLNPVKNVCSQTKTYTNMMKKHLKQDWNKLLKKFGTTSLQSTWSLSRSWCRSV